MAKHINDPAGSGWKINVICDEHNHEPATFLEGHAFAKRLSCDERDLVADMTKKKVAPRDILYELKKHNEHNVSTSETVYEARRTIRSAERLGQTPMQSMIKSLKASNYIYHIRKEPNSNKVQDLFFIHPLSMTMWRAFPHVLILDPTYKTNRYHLPFLQIVGLTSTNKTFCIAFAFIRNEMTDNFTWVLHCLRQTLDSSMLPGVIVTDRDLALMGACSALFPEANHLLCRYHIYENIRKRWRPSFADSRDWDKFVARWNRLVNCPTIDEYHNQLADLQLKYLGKEDLYKYLHENWLQNYKEMFVSAWIDQTLNYGERTTNRVESQHANLKNHFDNDRSQLDTFVGIIHSVVTIQHTQIKASFGESMNRIKHIHRNKTFDLLLTKVSLEALNLLTEEMKRLPTLDRGNNSCGHILRSSCGLPCACELSQYVTSGLSIPLDSINEFWKKLNFEPAKMKQDEQTPHTDDLHEYQKAFAEAYAKQESPVVKMSWLQKLKGIWDPSSTNYDEPAVQTKTRGRPSTKSKTQNKPDLPDAQPPLQRSYSTRPPRHSSYVPFGERDFAQQPTRHSSFREYTDQHPPAPSSFRDSDDIHGYQQPTTHNSYRDFDETPGYHSAYRPPYNENTYWNPFINQDNSWNPYNKQNTFGFTQPTEPTTFENQDAPADQDCSYYPSAGPTYSYFGVNDNTAEQSNFTTTEGPTEYDFLGLNQHNVGDRKSADYHNNIDQIPTVFQPYVKDIKNVLGDGNCGFRATASALGYNEDDWLQIRRMLIDEMVQFKRNYKKVFGADYDQLLSSLQWSGTGFAPEEYWMSMPYSGLLIANRFNVIVHFITKEHNSSSTLFPLWRGPDQFPEKKIITIAHVNSNHFVMVEMEGDFPMATTNNLWTHMKSKEATKWKRVFKERQDHYKSSFPDKPAEPPIYQTID